MTSEEIQQLKETLLQANNSILNTIKTSLVSNYSADHDLLNRLDEKVEIGFKTIQGDIKDLKDGTTKRIDDLEKDKADRHEMEMLQKKVNEDIEVRVREIEKFTSEAKGKASQNSVIIVYVISIISIIISGIGLLKK